MQNGILAAIETGISPSYSKLISKGKPRSLVRSVFSGLLLGISILSRAPSCAYLVRGALLPSPRI